MERTRLRGAPNTASAGPIAVSIRLSNARLRVRGTADFARRIHSRIRIGPESTHEGAIDATIRKSCFRASPGISAAFPDLVSDGDVRLQALVELPKSASAAACNQSFHGEDHVGCSILCCRGPRRMDDQVQRWRIRSLRKPRRGVRLRKSLPHKSSAHGASAPMCAWWMMTAASNPNGPTIGIIICAGAGHKLY